MAFSPTGHFIYVANYQSNDIYGYSVQANGRLVPLASHPVSVPGEPYCVTVHPSGRFVYAASDAGKVHAFAADTTSGALSVVSGSPFPAGDWALAVTVDPSGRFAYVAAGVGGTYAGPGYIAGYVIDPVTGALTAMNFGPFTAGIAPWSVAVDPTNQFVYATNAVVTSNNVSAYKMDPVTGELTAVLGSPFPAGNNPFAIVIMKIPQVAVQH